MSLIDQLGFGIVNELIRVRHVQQVLRYVAMVMSDDEYDTHDKKHVTMDL